MSDLEQAIEIEFVYNTNSMEGNTLLLGETRQVLKGMTISGKPLQDIQEVKNHPASIQFIKRLAFNRSSPLIERDILKLHNLAMTKVMKDAGKYRQDDNIAVKGAEFTPSPWYNISVEVKELLEFINNNPSGPSPFHDGNGRIARLLTNFILLRNHYTFVAFKKVERNQYLRNLQKADNGYFKPFLIYIAGLLSQSLDAYLQGIEAKKSRNF